MPKVNQHLAAPRNLTITSNINRLLFENELWDAGILELTLDRTKPENLAENGIDEH